MMQHHLTYMATKLVEDGIITHEQRDAAVASLAWYWSDKIAVSWSVTDIMDCDPELSEAQAYMVLEKLSRHDAAIGINWDVIKATIPFVKE